MSRVWQRCRKLCLTTAFVCTQTGVCLGQPGGLWSQDAGCQRENRDLMKFAQWWRMWPTAAFEAAVSATALPVCINRRETTCCCSCFGFQDIPSIPLILNVWSNFRLLELNWMSGTEVALAAGENRRFVVVRCPFREEHLAVCRKYFLYIWHLGQDVLSVRPIPSRPIPPWRTIGGLSQQLLKVQT